MTDQLVAERLISVFAFSGIAPFARDATFRIRKNRLIYCRLMLVALLVAQFLTFYLFQPYISESAFYTIAFVNTFAYGLGCICSTVLIHCRFGEICRLLNMIRECWGILRTALGHLNLPERQKNLSLTVQLNFLAIELSSVAFMGHTLAEGYKDSESYDIVAITSFIMHHCNLCCDFFFVFFVVNVRHLLGNLNRVLASTNFVTRFSEFELPECLATLRRIHHEYSNLLDIVSRVNSCFSGINFVSLSFSSSAVIFSVFFFVRGTWTSDDIYMDKFDLAYFLFFFINKTMSCLISAKKAQEEAEKTSLLLHGLFAGNSNPSTTDEVELLSLQLLHRKVEFDACGFFKLDFSLLLSMLSSVTTYIIILIQLESSQAGRVKCPPNFREYQYINATML